MADDIAIRVENLSKRYRIGAREEAHDTLAGMLGDWVKRPGHNLRRLRRLTQFDDNGLEQEDIIWALKDVSFEVKRGEVVGIIGRNGAGKSTLLKILSRITHPTKGRVELNGRVSSLLEVGTGFHPELTGRENIYLNGTILGMRRSEIDRKFDEIVDFSGIEKFIETPVKRYSSGMRVRLAFSVAAHLEPEILLVDEVLAVGDTEFQKKCLGKMEQVARIGRTVLFVSHNMAAITRLCEKSMLMTNGSIADFEKTKEVVNRYLDNASTLTEAPLRYRKDRLGAGEILLTSVKILNAGSGKEIQTIISGQDIIFEIGYCAQEKNRELLDGVTIGIQIFTSSKIFLTALNPYVLGISFSDLPSEGQIYCLVPKIPLMRGKHFVNLLLNQRELMDYVEDAFVFYVESGDYYGTGKDNSQDREGVFFEQNWSVSLEELL